MKILNSLKTTAVLASAALITSPVLAQDGVEGSIVKVTNTVNAGTLLVVAFSALAGLALIVAGGLQLKKYAENAQQTPLARPLLFIAAGALIFGLAGTSETAKQTLLGDASDSNNEFGDYSKGFETQN